MITCKDSESIFHIWENRRDALVSKLVNCLRKCDLLVAMHVLHCDVPSVQLMDDDEVQRFPPMKVFASVSIFLDCSSKRGVF